MKKWNHVVSGAAIHLLGRNEMCSCEASHVCQSCQGQDERLRAVNAKLLKALEDIRRIATTDPTNLPQKMFAGDIAARATAAIEANK